MLKPSPNHGAIRLSNDDDDIASIGKLYGYGCLLSMLRDSDIYAPVRLILEGKQGYETHARVPVSIVARSIYSIDTILRYQSSSWNETAVRRWRDNYYIPHTWYVQTTENYIKNATNTSALAELMCILDRNGTTDRQGTPMDYSDRRLASL